MDPNELESGFPFSLLETKKKRRIFLISTPDRPGEMKLSEKRGGAQFEVRWRTKSWMNCGYDDNSRSLLVHCRCRWCRFRRWSFSVVHSSCGPGSASSSSAAASASASAPSPEATGSASQVSTGNSRSGSSWSPSSWSPSTSSTSSMSSSGAPVKFWISLELSIRRSSRTTCSCSSNRRANWSRRLRTSSFKIQHKQKTKQENGAQSSNRIFCPYFVPWT